MKDKNNTSDTKERKLELIISGFSTVWINEEKIIKEDNTFLKVINQKLSKIGIRIKKSRHGNILIVSINKHVYF